MTSRKNEPEVEVPSGGAGQRPRWTTRREDGPWCASRECGCRSRAAVTGSMRIRPSCSAPTFMCGQNEVPSGPATIERMVVPPMTRPLLVELSVHMRTRAPASTCRGPGTGPTTSSQQLVPARGEVEGRRRPRGRGHTANQEWSCSSFPYRGRYEIRLTFILDYCACAKS